MKRRRRENRTDYKARRILLESGIPRIVVRRTNKYYILQAVESVEAQDKVIATVTSKELLKNGWDAKAAGSLKSIAAGYLTGMLMAKKLLAARGIPSKEGAKAPASSGRKYIVDLGMARTFTGSRVFAVVKGLIDGGLDVPANEKVFPSEDRLNGEHLKPEVKAMVAKVKEALK
jgi:large subunit ribosomal protein L18